jgi:hypothetical protein
MRLRSSFQQTREKKMGPITQAVLLKDCTPGATNPDVNQNNIHSTICVPSYSENIRPTAYLVYKEGA